MKSFFLVDQAVTKSEELAYSIKVEGLEIFIAGFAGFIFLISISMVLPKAIRFIKRFI